MDTPQKATFIVVIIYFVGVGFLTGYLVGINLVLHHWLGF